MRTSPRPRRLFLSAAMAIVLVTTGCRSGRTASLSHPVSTTSTTATPSTTPSTTTTVTTTTVTITTTSPFVGTVATLTAAQVAYTWHSGCPVSPTQLRMLQMSYWGFDDQAHVGTMVVNASVTGDVLMVFKRLFAEHFPIYQMQPEDAYHGSDPSSMAANNTSGFNCRDAVAPGPPQWSVHAYGEAIDVNTVENPYVEGGTVMPAAGAAYLNRADYRPGMAVPGGQLVEAFASVGWFWGGRWTTPDYQHFSKTGG